MIWPKICTYTHHTKLTANSQLACTICTSVKGNLSIPPGGSSSYSLIERGKMLLLFFNGTVDIQTFKQNSSHHSSCLIRCKWHWQNVRGEKIRTNAQMDKKKKVTDSSHPFLETDSRLLGCFWYCVLGGSSWFHLSLN